MIEKTSGGDTFTVRVKNEAGDWVFEEVSRELYKYITQLEIAFRGSETWGDELRKQYPDRF